MGTCGAKPTAQRKRHNQSFNRNPHKGLSFIEQVLTVNGVKNQQSNSNIDPKKILQYLQQSQHDTEEFVEKKVLLTEIQASSIIKRRQKVISLKDQSGDKQQLASPSLIKNLSIQQQNQNQKYQLGNKNMTLSVKYANHVGSEASTNYLQNYSTSNSFQPNFSQAQINLPSNKNANDSNHRQSARSLENIK